MFLAIYSTNMTRRKDISKATHREIVNQKRRSVDELTTFYIFQWVNNVFLILLKMWHIVVWFGPNWLGKSTPSFRIYYMIRNMPKYLSHHAFIIVKIVCCHSHYMNMRL